MSRNSLFCVRWYQTFSLHWLETDLRLYWQIKPLLPPLFTGDGSCTEQVLQLFLQLFSIFSHPSITGLVLDPKKVKNPKSLSHDLVSVCWLLVLPPTLLWRKLVWIFRAMHSSSAAAPASESQGHGVWSRCTSTDHAFGFHPKFKHIQAFTTRVLSTQPWKWIYPTPAADLTINCSEFSCIYNNKTFSEFSLKRTIHNPAFWQTFKETQRDKDGAVSTDQIHLPLLSTITLLTCFRETQVKVIESTVKISTSHNCNLLLINHCIYFLFSESAFTSHLLSDLSPMCWVFR